MFPEIVSVGVFSTVRRQLSHWSKCTVIDGKLIFENILNSLKRDVEEWTQKGHRRPRFVALTAAFDPSSLSYVKIKKKAAQFIGVDCDVLELSCSHSDNDVIRIIDKLNRSDDVDGILIQLPLYPHNNERLICDAVVHSKDIDGTSSASLGNLCMNKDYFIPCTSLAVHHVLKNVIGIDFCGKHGVVVGRSKHVGLPIAMLLHSSNQFGDIEGLNMTTTIAHRYTPRSALVNICESADVVVSAAGIPNLITSDMVKPGSVVIDVGITKIIDELSGKPILKGDVHFEEVKKKAMFLTAVPGGVGPVTVAMLMKNLMKAVKLQNATSSEMEDLTSETDDSSSLADEPTVFLTNNSNK